MRTLVSAFLCVIAIGASAQESNVLRMGAVTLQVPSTWSFEGSNQRVVGRGPRGEAVIANYKLLKAEAPQEAVDHFAELVQGFARDKMPSLASKNGEILQPVQEAALADGRVQYSSISQKDGVFGSTYFLQYLIGSKRQMLYMTVEGKGNAVEAATRFAKIIDTQQWQDQF